LAIAGFAGLAGLAGLARDALFASGLSTASGLAAFSSGFAATSVAPFFSAGASSPRSARLRFASLSDLKSVSYQPLPASRKRTADTRRLSDLRPHSGHWRSWGSESFCSASW
jgi:hypothetical protein